MSLSVTSEGRNERNERNDVTRNAGRPLTNAERQARHRAKRKAQMQSTLPAPAPSAKPQRQRPGGHKPGGSERYQEMKRQAEEADRLYAEAEARKPRKPSVPYSDALANIIIERLEQGEALHAICSTDDMPSHAAVHKWAAEMPSKFGDRYVRARELGYLKWADELDALAEGTAEFERRYEPGVVQRHRLQIDTRRWILSKMLPKVFGDKVQTDLTNSDGSLAVSNTNDLELARRLAYVLGAGLEQLLGGAEATALIAHAPPEDGGGS